MVSLPAAGSNDTMYNYSITYDLISRSGWRKLFARAFQQRRQREEEEEEEEILFRTSS